MTRFAGGPAESPGFVMWHATLAWQRGITAALAPLGLTHVQFVLLACTWWLGEHGEPPNQQQLATHSGAEVRMVSQVVRKLETKGLVERQVDTADSRARRLRVTAAGARLAADAVAVVEEADARFFGPAAAPLVAALRQVLPEA